MDGDAFVGDDIGPWSEIKLEIIRQYAGVYSTIVAKQRRFHHIYVDAFAGAGVHRRKRTGETLPGSPRIALAVKPPFREYHFIDMQQKKVESLEELAAGRTDVHVYRGDCNEIIPQKILPLARYEDYRRALCLLDPYGKQLRWEVIKQIAAARSVEILLNFPVGALNRTVLPTHVDKLDPEDRAQLKAVWGDESWFDAAYTKTPGLFKEETIKASVESLGEAFRKRLHDVAGFRYVPKPVLMRNEKNAPLYYLYFATHNETGAKIVDQIFSKYRRHGLR